MIDFLPPISMELVTLSTWSLQPWKWVQHIPPKYLYPPTRVITQKTIIWIFTTARTSNLVKDAQVNDHIINKIYPVFSLEMPPHNTQNKMKIWQCKIKTGKLNIIALFAGNFQLINEIGNYLCGEIPCHKNWISIYSGIKFFSFWRLWSTFWTPRFWRIWMFSGSER